MNNLIDPLRLKDLLWPGVTFYREQREIIYSVVENKETDVVAGNMLGKDFVAAFVVLYFFLTRMPCRIVTTSTKDLHLDVLWGEMGRFIQESKYPLNAKKGGPLIVNQREITRIVDGEKCPLSYVKGMVASPDSIQSFQGHHVANIGDGVPRTMFVGDEATSLPDDYHKMTQPWANRTFYFGNPWPCENFFRYAVEGKPGGLPGGDIKAESNGHYLRKVIKIRGEDSPNVRFGMAQKAAGIKPTDEMLVPGVLSYAEYIERRATWDPMLQKVSLDAEFYSGPQSQMYPREWLASLGSRTRPGGQVPRFLGVDSAMGGDNTCWIAGDKYGVVEMISKKTPDTNVIPGITVGLMRKYNIKDSNVYFDYGGGGKPHVDRLRAMGYKKIHAILFGASATAEKRRGRALLEDRKRQDEVRMVFKNRRAEMYWLLRERLDPANETLFHISDEVMDRLRGDSGPSLRTQLTVVPLYYDEEGKVYLPPKKAKTDDAKGEEKDTMTKRTGCSPDEADALVLLAFGLSGKGTKIKVGARR